MNATSKSYALRLRGMPPPRAFPRVLVLAAAALGARHASTIIKTETPISMNGLLGLRRADPAEADRLIGETMRYDPRRDPRVGTAFPGPTLSDAAYKSVALAAGKSRFHAIVFIGSCSPCAATIIAGWGKLAPLDVDLIIVPLSGNRQQVARLFKEQGWPAHPAFDPGGSVARVLNAGFLARGYVFDRLGRLVYIQSQNESFVQAVSFLRMRLARQNQAPPEGRS